ncbi:MAG: signal recognition particle-docking protein FtsY [Deltaproteobacteria bacterium]|nr:signal recognition particle-docking protein FtsY [Deltaproteobacteria bacterium]
MDEVSLLIEQALVWLTQNASIAVAAGSSLLALFLLFIDSRLSKASDEASVSSPEPAASIEPVPAQEIVAEPEPEPESEVAAAAEPSAAEVQELQPEPEPEPPPEPEPEPEPPPEPVRVGLRDRLSKTSQNLVGRLGRVLGAKAVDEALLEELEGVLLTADLGVASRVREVLREAIMEKLAKAEAASQIPLAQPGPHVILVLGVNGSGKTTTIGKLAAQYTRTGKQVVLGAGDTFRAAAAEQLQIWGERSGAEVVVGKAGGDPAAVAFDAVKTAITGGADVCIIDTAGRLQTKKPLMEELAKINRVLSRDIAQAPHECLLVLDSNTGQNAISQARLFTEVAEITGLVLTKLDGTAKGGVIVGLADEFEIPVKYVGVGEGIDDLQEFHAEEFVNALFEEG